MLTQIFEFRREKLCANAEKNGQVYCKIAQNVAYFASYICDIKILGWTDWTEEHLALQV